MKQLVISSRLFPPRVVAQARQFLAPGLTVRVRRSGGDRATVEMSADPSMGHDEVRAFKAALTAAAIHYFAARPHAVLDRGSVPPAPLWGGRRFNLSIDVFGERVMVCLDVAQQTWPRILRALARLRLTRPVVESTDPVDRVVLLLHLQEGGAVEEAICEFVGALRAELEGPAA